MEETYIRRGFGLKSQVRPLIDLEYQSALVQGIRAEGHRKVFGDITVRLAQEFGFCYGVDRAIDYAYETRHKFPEEAYSPGWRNNPQPARQSTHPRPGNGLHPTRR